MIAPEAGGGIASLELGDRQILSPKYGNFAPGAPTLAGIILLPFSNRIGNGRFVFQGQNHCIDPNVSGEMFPIHGDAHQKPWSVDYHTEKLVTLKLSNGRIGPFSYTATQTYHLEQTSLLWSVRLVNAGMDTLPFGVGFHPWFPRTAQTRLQFEAKDVWLNNDADLSEHLSPVPENPLWDFAVSSPLPDALINNAFVNWNRKAIFNQGTNGVTLRLTASESLSSAIIYSPSANSDFFCFEPISHPINAHNLPGMPGLVALESGQFLSSWIKLDWA